MISHEDVFQQTALHFAVAVGSAECVAELVERGARIDAVNKFGETPLILAARKNNAELLRLLLKSGDDPNSPNHDGESEPKIFFNFVSEETSLTLFLCLYDAQPHFIMLQCPAVPTAFECFLH